MSAYNSTPTCDADENYKRAKERVKKISEEKLGIENQVKTLDLTVEMGEIVQHKQAISVHLMIVFQK